MQKMVKIVCWKFSQHNCLLFKFHISEGCACYKKTCAKCKICVIVPDLPYYMTKYKWPKSWIKSANINIINRLRRKVDYYVLYSEKMANKLSLDKDRYIVVEGFIDKRKINIERKQVFNKRKICVYAGDLHPIYGIQMLIDSFKNIGVEAELHLYGKSELAKDYLYNNNVKYMGYLSSDKIFEIMKKSDLLINPRPSTLELAEYSFPSKTFEYMASGTPAIMCRLPSLTTEYLNHLYIFEEETVDGFKKTLENVLRLDESFLSKKGNDAAIFLYESKSSDIQVKKILTLMDS